MNVNDATTNIFTFDHIQYNMSQLGQAGSDAIDELVGPIDPASFDTSEVTRELAR